MIKIVSQGIPQRLVRDNQAYHLVAAIEGAAANTQFMQNLQVVAQQRRALEELRAKTEAAPAAEKAALESQAAQIEARLKPNLEFMAKTYAYSVQHNYLLVPVQSALLLKANDETGKPVEDEAKATLAAEFFGTEAYEELQALRQRLATLGGDASKQAEIDALKKQLSEKFGFDTGSSYFLQVRKGALYASIPEA